MTMDAPIVRPTPCPFSDTLTEILAMRSRLGEVPAIAPKQILRAPIWHDPQLASRKSTYRRGWNEREDGNLRRWIAETVNVLPKDGSAKSGSGLLRYLDLDLIIILSARFAKNGSRTIEAELADLLHEMGYDCPKTAPYDELKATVRRITNTKLAIFAEGTPNHLIRTWQIVDDAYWDSPSGIGKSSLVTTSLSKTWEDALVQGTWQAFNFHAYSQLVRTERRHGLARVLYLFFASWQNNTASFDVPVS